MKKLMLNSLLIFFAVGAGLSSSAASATELRIKNGRQILFELNSALVARGADIFELGDMFQLVIGNLPKTGHMSELAPGMDSIAKLTSTACNNYVSTIRRFVNPYYDADLIAQFIYQDFLARSATAEEINNVLRLPTGEIDIFETCFMVTLSPEFIFIPQTLEASGK